MKNRKMIKYIPKNTDYCGKCKNRVYAGRVKDFIICPKEIGSKEMIEVPISYDVYRCRYIGKTTLEDLEFDDELKICGEREKELMEEEYEKCI